MRVLATLLLVIVALAAAPATSAGQLPPVDGDAVGGIVGEVVDPVRDVVDQLPPPVSGPVNQVLDQLPPLPAAPVPTPVPVPTAVPTVRPVPSRTPAAASTPAAAATTPAPAATRGPAARTRTPSRGAARSAPPAPASRRPARRSAPSSAASPAARARFVTARSGDPRPAPSPAAARRPKPTGPPSFGARATGQIGDIVRAIPPAILWALAIVSLLAIALAANAYAQSRRRVALEAQRAVLLDDIGLLSRALLPAMPEGLGGVAVSAAYRPADGPAAGGDFYDVFAIDDRRVGVLLGDVSGHGRESVTQAALARYTLRTLLAEGDAPGVALARADVLLARDLRPNFVTVIAGVYDKETGELTYAKAGHAPPIVLGTAYDPDAEEPVPPIGIGVWEHWPEYRVRLGDGVSVCLFTDGLLDAKVGDARLGRGAVERLFAAQDVPDAGRLLHAVEDAADRVCDDTAAVVLSRRDT